MIFIEREKAVTMDELEKKLRILRTACDADEDNAVKEALRRVVPTFRRPEEVNREACEGAEIKKDHEKDVKELVMA